MSVAKTLKPIKKSPPPPEFLSGNKQFRNTIKQNLFLQSGQSDCGIACIATIASAFGQSIHPEQIKLRYGDFARGISLFGIKQIFTDLGIHVSAIKLSRISVSAIRFPAVVHQNRGHYLVLLHRFNNNTSEVFDPERGIIRLQNADIERLLSPVTLEIVGATPMQSPTPISYQKWLDRTLLRYSIGFLFVIVTIVMTLELLSPMLTERIFSSSTGGENLLTHAAIIFVAVLLGRNMFELFVTFIQCRIKLCLTRVAVNDILNTLAKLPAAFFDNRSAGNVGLPLDIAEQRLNDLIVVLPKCALAVPVSLIALFMIGNASVMLAACTIIGAVITFLLGVHINVKRQIMEDAELMENTAIGDLRFNLLENLGTLNGTMTSKRALEHYADIHLQHLARRNAINDFNARTETLQKFLSGLDMMAYAVIGALLTASGALTIGAFIALGIYRGFSHAGAMALVQLHQIRCRDRLFQRQLDALAHHPSQAPMEKSESFQALRAEQISYRPNVFQSNIIDTASLMIEKGDWVGITGASGSGKTSLCKLLTGFITPTSGSITINKDYPSLRCSPVSFAYLAQDAKLLYGSVRDNLTVFNPDINESSVHSAAEVAGIDQFIHSLPQGYNTRISEKHGALSGGQRQRLLLARALAQQPTFLILDEFSNNLDTDTVEHILAALTRANLTVLFVSHDDHVLTRCNKRYRLLMTEDNCVELSPFTDDFRQNKRTAA